MIYHKYLFQKTLIAFAAIISVLISLIWFSRAISFVKYVTENGVELSQFFYLFILILPWLLIFIIPVSLFAAVILTYNRMISTNEITILKNSGLTKIEICKPAILLAIICTAIAFSVSFYFMPYANKELRLSRINIQDNYANLSFSPQTFETLKELTIYARKRNEHDKLFGILLHDERSKQYSLTITAKSGKIVTENKSALLYMTEGTVQKFNYSDNKSEILNFDNYVFNLSENQKSSTTIRWKAKERFLNELLNPQNDADNFEQQKYRTEVHERITYPLLSFVFSLIGLAFILRGEFSRHGSWQNIAAAISVGAVFLGLTITTYNLTETSAKFTPLIYLNFIFFAGICLKMLISNNSFK